MSKFGKKSFKKPSGSAPAYKHSDPLPYSKTYFGLKAGKNDGPVGAYVLNLTVAELEKHFKVFEDMQNAHEWPISKLIQRELDRNRALQICRDYLLSDGYLKYFPPLTAVLLATDSRYLPADAYPAERADELKTLIAKVIKPRDDIFGGNETKQRVVAGGIYEIFAEDIDSGMLVWDENVLSAVIIDGQHRYKALMEAVAANKDFLQCRVSVNLIDLASICKREKKGPTALARDLFVTINNTPVEVDEARLILMDDRDALATFTQVLVDDSVPIPAVSPELVDWKCEQGKHDSELSLTGVLTIRGVIGAAMFDNRTIASVDARSNRNLVKKWISKLNLWLAPDDYIRKKLNQSETLEERFNAACASVDISSEEEDDEEHDPFLFSYSAAAAELIKIRFRELYLEVFREVYTKLTPFKNAIALAESSGAFEKNSGLHRYLRAFQSQRRMLEKEDAEVRSAVAGYKKKLGTITQNSIPFTVMGQKALFKALFEGYLSDIDPITNKALLTQTQLYVENFNETYDLLQSSSSFDENFFSTKLKLKKGIETNVAGDLGREFWRGIILGFNGEIDYGPTAVELLKSILLDAMLFEENGVSQFSLRDKIVSRHISILRKYDSDISDVKAIKIATKIVEGKEKLVYGWLT